MPLQNRVTPKAQIIACDARGTFMGNRGIIHDPATRTLKTRRWQHKAWICCLLKYKDWQHPIMGKGAYTELFFLDEATALAAGHRPCALCRRTAFNTFKRLFATSTDKDPSTLKAPDMDQLLHKERVTRDRRKVTYNADIDDLPTGVFIRYQTHCALLHHDTLRVWSPQGYAQVLARPRAERVEVLTPCTIVEVIKTGYQPELHVSVGAS